MRSAFKYDCRLTNLWGTKCFNPSFSQSDATVYLTAVYLTASSPYQPRHCSGRARVGTRAPRLFFCRHITSRFTRRPI
jgi:hypothetical protein